MLASGVLALTCPQEQHRVRQHLEGALAQLTTIEPAGLTETQRAHRANALAVLREYIDRGEFPSNPGVPLTPIFVDASGVRCAMGEVLAKLGGDDIVRHVQQTRNLATVGELRDEPGLVAWLTEHGLTPEEAALVQPSYEECGPWRLITACGSPFDGEPISAGLARSLDGGAVEIERLVGSQPPATLRTFYSSWPDGTLYLWSTDTNRQRRLLVRRGEGFVSSLDRHCGRAATASEAVARRAIQAPQGECERALLEVDPRWVLYTCIRYGMAGDRPRYSELCSDTGTLVADEVQPRATAQAWLEANGHGDAGVDLSGYDAWATEQPGPPVVGTITLDAPPALPLASGGCSQTAGALSLAALVVFARRQRRSRNAQRQNEA